MDNITRHLGDGANEHEDGWDAALPQIGDWTDRDHEVFAAQFEDVDKEELDDITLYTMDDGEARQHDAPLPQVHEPSPRVAEIEGILESNPDRYFGDKAMQQEYAGLMGADAWSGETNNQESE